MKKFAVLSFILAICIPAVHSQKKVLGTVDYSYNLSGEGSDQMAGMLPEKMIIKFGENGLSMVMQGGMMAQAMGKTVVNGESGEAFMIRASEKTIYIMSTDDIEAQAANVDNAEISKTEETKEIMGYPCTKYLQTISSQGMSITQSIWITEKLVAQDYQGKAFKGIVSQSGMNLNMKGFPLLIEMDMPGMPIKLKLEVTNIAFEKIDPAEFEKPSGYTEKPFSEMNPF